MTEHHLVIPGPNGCHDFPRGELDIIWYRNGELQRAGACATCNGPYCACGEVWPCWLPLAGDDYRRSADA